MSKPTPSKGKSSSFLTGEQRINKLLAAAGFGSRRQVDELIVEGRVEIDGKTVTQVGTKVNADEAKILVDGEPLKRHKPVYYAVHKPAGFLCTNADPEGRPRVIELVPADARLFPVGRLDSSSTGLILLTNDGELAQRLAHPKHGVQKTYFVVVAGQVDREAMHRLQRGIYLAEGIARVDGATIRKVRKGCTEIDITLSEGKNREIRRVLARLGHKVVVLRRTAIGPLKLADLPEGAYRSLHEREVAALYQTVEDIKKARNIDRRERKKRSDELATKSPAQGKKPTKPFAPVYDEEGDSWDDQAGLNEDSFEADSILDSLPPMSQNPYRTADDESDDAGDKYTDSILVSDTNSDEVYSNKRGAVLSYDDEFEAFEDSGDDELGIEDGLVEEAHDEGERPSSGPYGKRPRGARNQGNSYGRGEGRGDRAGREPRGQGRPGRPEGGRGRGGNDNARRGPGYGERRGQGMGERRGPTGDGERRGPGNGGQGRRSYSRGSGESAGRPYRGERGRSPYRNRNESPSAPLRNSEGPSNGEENGAYSPPRRPSRRPSFGGGNARGGTPRGGAPRGDARGEGAPRGEARGEGRSFGGRSSSGQRNNSSRGTGDRGRDSRGSGPREGYSRGNAFGGSEFGGNAPRSGSTRGGFSGGNRRSGPNGGSRPRPQGGKKPFGRKRRPS